MANGSITSGFIVRDDHLDLDHSSSSSGRLGRGRVGQPHAAGESSVCVPTGCVQMRGAQAGMQVCVHLGIVHTIWSSGFSSSDLVVFSAILVIIHAK